MKHAGHDESAPIRVGVLTVSDSVHGGSREVDASGQAARQIIEAQLEGAVASEYAVVPDDQGQIEATLRHWADNLHLDLVLTTGGTGLTSRDVTPEATLAIAHRTAPGFSELMRAATAQFTILSYLSRAVTVQRGGTLIVNLPGSPAAVEQCLTAIMPLLPHAVRLVDDAVGQHAD